ARCHREPGPGTAGARPARARVPAQAALALGLSPAPHELRRVRRSRALRRLLARCRGRGLPELRGGLAGAFSGGARRDRRAVAPTARGGSSGRAGRPGRPGRADADHGLVRIPRRLSPEDRQRVTRALPTGFELDDDPARIDVDAVHDFLSNHAYWATGRARETVERLVREADR